MDPVANLVTKEFPKTVLTPPPPTSTKSNQARTGCRAFDFA